MWKCRKVFLVCECERLRNNDVPYWAPNLARTWIVFGDPLFGDSPRNELRISTVSEHEL